LKSSRGIYAVCVVFTKSIISRQLKIPPWWWQTQEELIADNSLAAGRVNEKIKRTIAPRVNYLFVFCKRTRQSKAADLVYWPTYLACRAKIRHFMVRFGSLIKMSAFVSPRSQLSSQSRAALMAIAAAQSLPRADINLLGSFLQTCQSAAAKG